MPVIVPIPIQQRPRECIVVEGRKYCEVEQLDRAEVGWTILAVLLWVAIIGYTIIEDFPGWIIGIVIAGPFVAFAIWLIVGA